MRSRHIYSYNVIDIMCQANMVKKIVKLSIADIVEITGRDFAQVSRWFAGKNYPNPVTLVELADTIGVCPYELGRYLSDRRVERYLGERQ